MLAAAREFMRKWGLVGIVTYLGVDSLAFGTTYALIASRTIDPLPFLLRLVESAKDSFHLDLSSLTEKLHDVERLPPTTSSRFGADILMTMACTKLLTPFKLPVAAILTPRVLRFYNVWLRKYFGTRAVGHSS